MEQINLKKEGLSILAGVGYVVALLIAIQLFRLNIYQVYIVLLAGSVILLLYSGNFKLKALLIQAITLALVLFLIRWLGGVAGSLVSTAAICGLILFARRKRFMEVKEHMETMIWKKPLKEYVKEGEKPPKVKIEL